MNPKNANRRKVLRFVGAALGACTLTCAAPLALLAGKNAPPPALPLHFPETSLGDQAASRKILVAYASADGSTGGAAEIIGQALAESGAAVDLKRVQPSLSLDGYPAVVLGSAIHGGRWLPEMTQFLEANQEALRRVPVAFFLIGMMAASRSDSSRAYVQEFLAAERKIVSPVAEGRFAGALYPEKFPFVTGLGMRFFLAYCGLGTGGGDYRDPAAMRAWAAEIFPLLA